MADETTIIQLADRLDRNAKDTNECVDRLLTCLADMSSIGQEIKDLDNRHNTKEIEIKNRIKALPVNDKETIAGILKENIEKKETQC